MKIGDLVEHIRKSGSLGVIIADYRYYMIVRWIAPVDFCNKEWSYRTQNLRKV